MSELEKTELTTAQKCRMERNRAKALNIRQTKLVCHPYAAGKSNCPESSIIKVQGTKYVDSGGGFLIEETHDKLNENVPDTEKKNQEVETINIPITYQECIECGDQFVDSFLYNNFQYSVCDKCRDPDERHSLITRTEAKAEYLLKDCDFDRREPILRFISRKNPHNVRWGEMKLYLHLQVQQRAMEIWGTEEELMRQHENREEKREVSKVRKYNKQMKKLRMEIRSSLYTKDTKVNHEHEYGPETYNEEDDNYTRSCTICPFVQTYEKM
ncbi:DNA repair protein complementing XP-A cells homolog [Teleopsis dalmanni]|uniref:DNA repair protein complementing XP-A cells homolog n=1 Tax=Teleopsis dalmanni TaxID=139649 RepID=UPI0018CCB029|nr:DNA repair protein complementing XP-A cells homolog [Teleopsis dalmanni]